VLETARLEAMPELPLVVGGGANRRIGDLAALIERAPRLRPLIAGATWVGDRRWDLRFSGGEVLMLPEGEEASRRAIERFALMDQQDPMLGRGFVRIDMRDSRRTYIRISRDPGATVPTLTPDPGEIPTNLQDTI
jgi:cell division protein FtsQ